MRQHRLGWLAVVDDDGRLVGIIAHKGEKAPIRASQRWHVERTNAWHNAFNRLQGPLAAVRPCTHPWGCHRPGSRSPGRWQPRKSRPCVMWVIRVFSCDRRKPIDKTPAISSRGRVASVLVPCTTRHQSSANQQAAVLQILSSGRRARPGVGKPCRRPGPRRGDRAGCTAGEYSNGSTPSRPYAAHACRLTCHDAESHPFAVIWGSSGQVGLDQAGSAGSTHLVRVATLPDSVEDLRVAQR